MAKETTLADIVDILQEHILAMKAHTVALDRASGGGHAARPRAEANDPPAREEKAENRTEPAERPRRTRGTRDEKTADIPEPAERLKAIKGFLAEVDDLFENAKEGDTEHEKRLEDVIDPILAKADVAEVKDIPGEFWAELIARIEAYRKKFKEAREGGSTRRRRA